MTRKRPPQSRSQKKIDAILSAAMSEIAAGGWDKLTTNKTALLSMTDRLRARNSLGPKRMASQRQKDKNRNRNGNRSKAEGDLVTHSLNEHRSAGDIGSRVVGHSELPVSAEVMSVSDRARAPASVIETADGGGQATELLLSLSSARDHLG